MIRHQWRRATALSAVVAGLTALAAQSPAPPDPLSGLVTAERSVRSECRQAASIAVVPAPGSEPAGAGMMVAALGATRLRSGAVTIVERSGLDALAAESCRTGAPQHLIFAKFMAMVTMTERGGTLGKYAFVWNAAELVRVLILFVVGAAVVWYGRPLVLRALGPAAADTPPTAAAPAGGKP